MVLERICEHLLAYVAFTLENNSAKRRKALEATVNEIPEFLDCLRLNDNTDYIGFICCPNVQALNGLCNHLSGDPARGLKASKPA